MNTETDKLPTSLPPTLDQLLNLSDEELQLECAKVLGWNNIHRIHALSIVGERPPQKSLHLVPEYSTNLNDIHEVELSLAEVQKAALDDLLYDNGGYSATCHQRCACVTYIKYHWH